jgi:hypothetical protein
MFFDKPTMTPEEVAGRAAAAEQMAAQRRQWREARRRARQARIRLVEETIAAGWGFVLRDLGGLAGAGLLAYGAWQSYPPAGYLVGGALLLAGAWIAGRKDPG